MNETLDTILKRRSTRQYASREVEAEKITRLLQAAMAAPSARNSRPWEFVVVTDRKVLARLDTGQYNAPCAIVVCGNLNLAGHPAAGFYWVQDCSAATQNILIAATGMGLGSVWTGVYPLPENIAAVIEAVHLPEGVIPLSVVLLGYPLENGEDPARARYDESRVHWQQYGGHKQPARPKN
ncbi:MAG: nitroreductase family protein, partial [Chloroflexi bacterium]|nr:nitroreductase family protein [Chloroflexota bacterium]